MEKLAIDLKPGDKYVTNREGYIQTVEILSEQSESPNQFGLAWFRYLATNGERTGYVSFGPKAKVTLA